MAGLNTKGKMSITELDFDTIKGNLKTYLKGQTEFTDFDFEGSGMSVLLDTLAYNTHIMLSWRTWLLTKCSWIQQLKEIV